MANAKYYVRIEEEGQSTKIGPVINKQTADKIAEEERDRLKGKKCTVLVYNEGHWL